MAEAHLTSSEDHDEDVERAAHKADDRDQTADERDRTAEAIDQASDDRDERADARDKRAEIREADDARLDVGAASDRAGAKRDRQGGATDRRHAVDDREAASTDRDLSARERAVSLVDELTGAHRRDAGILELEREVTKAQRTKQPFVLVFIDVDGLKRENDSRGHAAGDGLLRHVIDTMRAHVRSYDLIVRYGGDEFLCGLADVTLDEVANRFELVNADLASSRQASVTAGMAELAADDRLEDLIHRADAALYEQRRGRSAGE